eukprot:Amastigsp_a676835_141.p3 type:complete len:138 gc:universal Amastigsp_a676835_141:413-826(+)
MTTATEFVSTSMIWSVLSAATMGERRPMMRHQAKSDAFVKMTNPRMTSVGVLRLRSLERATSDCTELEMICNAAVPITDAKTMMPSGSSRRRPTGYLYGSRFWIARSVKNMMSPESRSRTESTMDAITESERDAMAA